MSTHNHASNQTTTEIRVQGGDVIKPIDIRRLSSLKRWSIVATLVPQSVAEHHHNVAWYATYIAKRFFSEAKTPVFTCDNHQDAFLLRLLATALSHDTGEIFTGDFPTPVKKELPSVRGLEARVDARLGWLSLSTDVGDNLLTMIVKAADLMDAVAFLSAYRMPNDLHGIAVLDGLEEALINHRELMHHAYGREFKVRTVLSDLQRELVAGVPTSGIQQALGSAQ